jgi:hypothetical protein
MLTLVSGAQARNQLSASLEEIQKLNDLILSTLVSPSDAEDRIQQSADVRSQRLRTQHRLSRLLGKLTELATLCRIWCERSIAWVK